jgi:hypothetical protein
LTGINEGEIFSDNQVTVNIFSNMDGTRALGSTTGLADVGSITHTLLQTSSNLGIKVGKISEPRVLRFSGSTTDTESDDRLVSRTALMQ